MEFDYIQMEIIGMEKNIQKLSNLSLELSGVIKNEHIEVMESVLNEWTNCTKPLMQAMHKLVDAHNTINTGE